MICHNFFPLTFVEFYRTLHLETNRQKHINAMNRIVLTILFISICCCPLLANISNDDGPVVVIVKDKQTTGHTQTNRTCARILIQCYYYPFTSNIELSFLSNLGTVNVLMENQTTGEVQDYAGTSSSGVMLIPVVSNSAYRMDITTENGHGYYAVFFTDGESDE